MDHVEVNIHEDGEEITRGKPTTNQTESEKTNLAPKIKYHPSIYRVPECFRKHSPHHFTPALVSFGPFHHDTGAHLRAMEAQKRRVLYDILFRLDPETSGNINEQSLVAAMCHELPGLLRCYTGFEGLSRGNEEYIHILMRSHGVDTIARRIVKDGLQDRIVKDGLRGNIDRIVEYGVDEESDLDRLLCQVVKEGVAEFAHLLVNKVDGDEFVRFMVRGDDVARLMLRHSVQCVVRDTVRGCLLEKVKELKLKSVSGIPSILVEELAPNMVRKGIAEFTRRLVRDGLDALARLMVRDGVFQISLMVAAARKVATENEPDNAVAAASPFIDCPLFGFARGWQFDDNDTVFGKKASKEIWDYIRRDMVLIENQIPMQVLRILLGELSPSVQLQDRDLHLHVRRFIAYPQVLHNPGREQLHILDCYKDYRTMGRLQRCTSGNARTLYFRGVNIKHGESFYYDKIDQIRDTLYIPRITLHDHEAACIQNLLAFEYLYGGTDSTVTNYVLFMARLVGEPLHVKILQARYNIRLSDVWTNEEVSAFFQLAGRFDPEACTKSPQMKVFMQPFTKQPWLWPITCYRFFVLLLLEDRGKSINYIALAVALMTWLLTIKYLKYLRFGVQRYRSATDIIQVKLSHKYGDEEE